MFQVTVFGHLGQDSEIKTVNTPNGSQDILQFSLGVKTNEKDQQGKPISRWFNCSLWGSRATKLDQYFKKGTALVILGEHTVKLNTAANGTTYLNEYITVREFSFAGRSSSGNNEAESQSPSEQYHAKNAAAATETPADDLPF